MTNGLFKDLKLGVLFQMNKYDSTKWIKTSNRTARLLENNRVFYFRKNEQILGLSFLDSNDVLRKSN